MDRNKLLQTALLLSIITVAYNIVEGLVSVGFGVSDDALALLGFGVDTLLRLFRALAYFT